MLKTLAKKRDERYSDAATMLEALRTAEAAGESRSIVLPDRLSCMGRVLCPDKENLVTLKPKDSKVRNVLCFAPGDCS